MVFFISTSSRRSMNYGESDGEKTWPDPGLSRNTRCHCYRCSVPGLAGFTRLALCGARDLITKTLMAERVGFEPTERFPVHSISSAASSTTPAPLRSAEYRSNRSYRTYIYRTLSDDLMAERVGFEPTVAVKPLRFSRPVH